MNKFQLQKNILIKRYTYCRNQVLNKHHYYVNDSPKEDELE